MFYDEYLTGLSDMEVGRWAWLRSIEWANWPIFLSQPLVPIAFLFFKWWSVLAILYIMNILWSRVRYKYYNPYLSTFAARFAKLKWPVALGIGIYFFIHCEYELSMLATLWPVLCVSMMLTGNLERIRKSLATTIGYYREGESYGFLEAVQRIDTKSEKNRYTWLNYEVRDHTLNLYR